MQDIWQILFLSKGDLSLHILPGIGGRLWDITFKGQSFLFQNNDLNGAIPDMSSLEKLPTKSPHFKFPLWGGEKTWVSPDSLWPADGPYPILDSGSFEILSLSEDQITMQSQICNVSQLQIKRTIKLLSNARIRMTHMLTNHGTEDRLSGIWSVLMLNHPTQVGIVSENPQITRVFGQPDGHYKDDGTSIICTCDNKAEYKFGTDNPSGRVFLNIGMHGDPIWMMCLTRPPSPDDVYAHNHSFEIFNSGDYPYCEAEWHAPVMSLKPNESTEFEQLFTLWSGQHPPKNLALSHLETELISCMS